MDDAIASLLGTRSSWCRRSWMRRWPVACVSIGGGTGVLVDIGALRAHAREVKAGQSAGRQ